MNDFLADFHTHYIIGIGSDICDIRRIEKIYNKFGESFLKKTYSTDEISVFHTLPKLRKIPFLAKRFAAKEAVVKALGTGFGKSAYMTDITTLSCQETKKPLLTLTGHALKTAYALCKQEKFDFFISLSDENDIAQAFCVFALVREGNRE